MAFNVIDLLLIAVIILSLINGYRRGFVHGVLDLAGWVLSLLAGLRYYQPVAQWIGPRIDMWSEVWDQPIAFIFIGVIVTVIVHLIGNALLKRLPKDIDERPVNRALGLLPGFANGLIVAAILSALLLAVPLSEGLSERARDSVVASRLSVYAERLESQLRPVFADAIGRTFNLLTIRPDSSERVTLPFKVESTRPRPDLEQQMLEMVNKERTASGLRPLVADPEATQATGFQRGQQIRLDQMPAPCHVDQIGVGSKLLERPLAQNALGFRRERKHIDQHSGTRKKCLER